MGPLLRRLHVQLRPVRLDDPHSRADVRVIERAQSRSGGWYYEPVSASDEGSVTVTQVQALRAARNAGIRVSMDTVRKAMEYINRSTDGNGRTNYRLGTNRSTFALTAAGMSVLHFLGKHENPKLKKGLQYLISSVSTLKPDAGRSGAWGSWYFYANYYATLACFLAGTPYWEKWWPVVSQDLIRRQNTDGSWTYGESSRYGTAFGTGIALQILQIPHRFSPIYQGASD